MTLVAPLLMAVVTALAFETISKLQTAGILDRFFASDLLSAALFLFYFPMLLLGIPYLVFVFVMLRFSKGKSDRWLEAIFALLPLIFIPFAVSFDLLIDPDFPDNAVTRGIGGIGMWAFLAIVWGYPYILAGALFWIAWWLFEKCKNDT